MLKLQFRDQRKPAIWLVDAQYSIGSDPQNDIVLEDTGVSPWHAHIRVEDHDRVFITDAGSVGSTRVNGEPVRGRTRLRARDLIQIDSVELELLDPKEQAQPGQQAADATAISHALRGLPDEPEPVTDDSGWTLKARSGPMEGQSRAIPARGALTIGRSRGCDLVLSSKHVSRQHAQLYVHQGRLWVRDLGSSNGTWVNHKKVREQALQSGDELRFDTLAFEVHGPVEDGRSGGAGALNDSTGLHDAVPSPRDEPVSAAPELSGAEDAVHSPEPGIESGWDASAPGPAPAVSASGGQDPGGEGERGGLLGLVVVVLAVIGVAWWLL